MSTKKRRNTNKTVGVGMTAKQMRRKRPINNGMLVDVEPITDNQKILFDHYDKGKNIFAYGCAGTGKTFISLYLALKDVLDETTPFLHSNASETIGNCSMNTVLHACAMSMCSF